MIESCADEDFPSVRRHSELQRFLRDKVKLKLWMLTSRVWPQLNLSETEWHDFLCSCCRCLETKTHTLCPWKSSASCWWWLLMTLEGYPSSAHTEDLVFSKWCFEEMSHLMSCSLYDIHECGYHIINLSRFITSGSRYTGSLSCMQHNRRSR